MASTTFALYRHQKLALQYMRVNDSFALFMEQGCGKTLPTLCRILELVKEGCISNALVVAPKTTMGVWYRDIEIFASADQKLLLSAMTIINYDKVWRRTSFNREWGCIVLDESHKIKTRTAKRANALLRIALKSKYRYILTGTPIGNGQLENIWAQYAFLQPYLYIYKNGSRVASRIFGTYAQFETKYCVLNQYWKPYKYLHVDE
ncbi:SNF2-related protein, partial [Candidatus Hakubella thermalkaliphila]